MDDRAPSMLKPTLIGGAVCGLLAGLADLVPVVGGCACCLLLPGGGFLAAYLYSTACSAAGVAFRAGGGAMVGLIAGLFYSVTNVAIGGILRLVKPPDMEQIYSKLEASEIPPEMLDSIMRALEMFQGPLGLLISFFVVLLCAAVFSTIGGLIGGAVFKVEPAPPAADGGAFGA